MQEENSNNSTTPLADSMSSTTSSISKPNQTQAQTSLLKDLMIPLSIIIAGLFIGGGLYYGGGTTLQAGTAPLPVAQKATDNTKKIDAVTADDHIKGDLNAPIKIVEFSDFDCPFCSRFHDSMETVVSNTSDVAWVYRHFPLEQLHPQAASVAMASECVAEQGGDEAFWAFTDGYFVARGAGDKTEHGALISKLVATTGVDLKSFTECFESGKYLDIIQSHTDDAVETGGRGTPWSIIVGPTGKTYPVNGALPQQAIEQMIEIARKEA